VVNGAYLTGFRVVMGVSAGLAFVSALIAWRIVEELNRKVEYQTLKHFRYLCFKIATKMDDTVPLFALHKSNSEIP
jgi:hypothetical protein